jgi:hypothetical protein
MATKNKLSEKTRRKQMDFPHSAEYGAYDNVNGEWLDIWYSDFTEAQAAANDNDDENISIVNIRNDEVVE